MTLSTEHGFPHWVAMGTILRGGALVERGQGEEGIAQMRQGIAGHLATGAELVQPYFLALLAEGYGKVGQIEEGLTVLAAALDLVNKNGERFYEAELYRLKGELMLMQAVGAGFKPAPTETCFRQAIDIAHRQIAKSLELRAAMSLCRLLQRQGEREEAQQMLAQIYGWFTEGFDTADLKEAKALLEEIQ